jgi:hypothetical protein
MVPQRCLSPRPWLQASALPSGRAGRSATSLTARTADHCQVLAPLITAQAEALTDAYPQSDGDPQDDSMASSRRTAPRVGSYQGSSSKVSPMMVSVFVSPSMSSLANRSMWWRLSVLQRLRATDCKLLATVGKYAVAYSGVFRPCTPGRNLEACRPEGDRI